MWNTWVTQQRNEVFKSFESQSGSSKRIRIFESRVHRQSQSRFRVFPLTCRNPCAHTHTHTALRTTVNVNSLFVRAWINLTGEKVFAENGTHASQMQCKRFVWEGVSERWLRRIDVLRVSKFSSSWICELAMKFTSYLDVWVAPMVSNDRSVSAAPPAGEPTTLRLINCSPPTTLWTHFYLKLEQIRQNGHTGPLALLAIPKK